MGIFFLHLHLKQILQIRHLNNNIRIDIFLDGFKAILSKIMTNMDFYLFGTINWGYFSKIKLKKRKKNKQKK